MQPNVSASVNSAENNNVAINDNYSNDSILIMLNNESSLKFKEYDINDFIDIYFGSITEITTGTTKIVKR